MMAGDGPDPQLLTMLEYDWVSNTSMTHLSFLMRHALFIQYPIQEAAICRIRAYESLIESEFRGDKDLLLLCTGISYEGVFPPSLTGILDDAIPPNADLSYLYVLKKWTIDDQVVPPEKKKENTVSSAEVLPARLVRSSEESSVSLAHYVTTDKPGKVMIKLRTSSKELSKYAIKDSQRNNEQFLIPELMREKVSAVISNVKKVADLNAEMGEMTVDDFPDRAFGKVHKNAWVDQETLSEPVTDSESPQNISATERYLDFGLSSTKWPSLASEWKTRKRRHEWPDQSDINVVVSNGCHFLAPPCDTDNKTNSALWDVSFALPERTLVCSLVSAQRKAYVVLLTLYHRHLACPQLLTAQHIKHTLFWTCEQSSISIWRDDNMAECLLLLLDRLIHFLCDKFMPDYFLPTRNLLEDISNEDTLTLLNKVSYIRKSPMETLTACYEQLKIVDGASFEDLFKPILAYDENCPDDEHPLESIVQSAFTIGHMFLSFDSKDQALILFEEGCELMLQISQPDHRSLSILQLTAWLYVQTGLIEKAIEYYEIIVSISGMENAGIEGFNFQTCLANLACLYHVKSVSISDTVIKSHLVDKAQGCFEVAFNQDKCLHTVVHYSIFLKKNGKQEKALSLLLDCHSEDNDMSDGALWEHMTSFIEIESDTLDEDLASEVREAGELEVPTVVLTQYLISKCLIELGKRKQAKESNRALSRLCRSDLNEKKDIAWMLLGYCFKAMEDFHSALKAFESAMQNSRYNPLAEEMYADCKANIKDGSESEGDEGSND